MIVQDSRTADLTWHSQKAHEGASAACTHDQGLFSCSWDDGMIYPVTMAPNSTVCLLLWLLAAQAAFAAVQGAVQPVSPLCCAAAWEIGL